MGVIEISALIAIVGCAIGVLGWVAGRDKRITSDAQWRGSVDAKLDLIIGLRKDSQQPLRTSGKGRSVVGPSTSSNRRNYQ